MYFIFLSLCLSRGFYILFYDNGGSSWRHSFITDFHFPSLEGSRRDLWRGPERSMLAIRQETLQRLGNLKKTTYSVYYFCCFLVYSYVVCVYFLRFNLCLHENHVMLLILNSFAFEVGDWSDSWAYFFFLFKSNIYKISSLIVTFVWTICLADYCEAKKK